MTHETLAALFLVLVLVVSEVGHYRVMKKIKNCGSQPSRAKVR